MGEKMQVVCEWFKTSEKKPELDSSIPSFIIVIACYDNGKRRIYKYCRRMIRGKIVCRWEDYYTESIVHEEPDYWMYLPKPVKGGDVNE